MAKKKQTQKTSIHLTGVCSEQARHMAGRIIRACRGNMRSESKKPQKKPVFAPGCVTE